MQAATDNKELSYILRGYGWPRVGKVEPIMLDLQNVVDQHYKKYGEVSRVRMAC